MKIKSKISQLNLQGVAESAGRQQQGMDGLKLGREEGREKSTPTGLGAEGSNGRRKCATKLPTTTYTARLTEGEYAAQRAISNPGDLPHTADRRLARLLDRVSRERVAGSREDWEDWEGWELRGDLVGER
ncbi:hypothetical protein PG989_014562 [Apiospora arundinis]